MAATVLTDFDGPAIFICVACLVIFAVGALGFATELLGRRANNAILRRMLGRGIHDGPVIRTVVGAAWSIFFVALTQGMALSLLANGVKLGQPWRAGAASVELIAAAVVFLLILRGTVRDDGETN